MKIIYSGGWNNKLESSIKASFMFTYHETIRQAVAAGNKIAMVTLAKDDGHYDNIIIPLYGGLVDIIDYKTKHVSWETYDGIFIPGGTSSRLKDGLERLGFSLNALKRSAVLLGDSAGAHVLSSYFYITPPGPERGKEITFAKGFNPSANLIQIAHKNNPVYCNDLLISKVNVFAGNNNLSVLILNENEQRMWIDGRAVEVTKQSLFPKG